MDLRTILDPRTILDQPAILDPPAILDQVVLKVPLGLERTPVSAINREISITSIIKLSTISTTIPISIITRCITATGTAITLDAAGMADMADMADMAATVDMAAMVVLEADLVPA